MPPTLRLDRVTVYLACLCLLRIKTRLSCSEIANLLKGNFPEYDLLTPDVIRQIYGDVERLRPEWIREMYRADRHSDEIEQMLHAVRSGQFSSRDRFPRDTRHTREMLDYIAELMRMPEEQEMQRVEEVEVRRMAHGRESEDRPQRVDQDYLDALPEELREEVLMQQHAKSSHDAGESTDISHEFLEALPPDIRSELLQQRAQDDFTR
ncbi:hypothetical protein MMC29_006865 [Sticta canariensis]|nr:hypothetical protein [Sticta canariensis]